jgi:diacylglycerol O-acyltransferase
MAPGGVGATLRRQRAGNLDTHDNPRPGDEMSKTIPPLDLIWLLIETANVPAHVGAVMVFEPPAGSGPGFVGDIVRSYRAATPRPPFNYVPDLVHAGMPRWKPVRAVDLEYHVQHIALPAGASEHAFLRLVEDLHEPVLDRNRPGFRMWAIEGLPGGRFAFYMKVHHSLVDGMSAVMRIGASMAPSPADPLRPPFFAVDVGTRKPRPPQGLVEQVMALNKTAWRQSAAIGDLSLNLVKKTFRRLLSRAQGDSTPLTASHLPMNEPLCTPRAFAILSIPLEEMRAAGHAFGGTINDVAVTILDAALHRYLAGRGVTAKAPLLAMCPVSLRDADDTSASTKATIILAPMGAPRASIGERMAQVMSSLAAGKDDARAMSTDAAMMYGFSAFGVGTLVELARVGRATGHLAHVLISNVPGTKEQMYVGGARTTGVFPISGVAAGVGLNATLTSYAGIMNFGFVGNRVAIPDVDVIARYTGEAFEELKAAAARRSGAAPAGRSGKAAKRTRAASSKTTASRPAAGRHAPRSRTR